MNEWSRKRKRVVLVIVLAILIFLLAIPLFFILHRTPTCSDGKQNGDETGIDCGGGCQLLCAPDSLPIIMRGDPRILKVASSTYEVVVIAENPNTDASIANAGYEINLFEASSSLAVKMIEDKTYVPAGSLFAIFVGPFTLPDGVTPARATFDWRTPTLIWQKGSAAEPALEVLGKSLTGATTSPHFAATVQNTSLAPVSNIELVALVKDESGTIFAASKTYIDTLAAGASTPVVFTWPRPFDKTPIDTSIIIRIFPDTSYLR